jgi:phage gp29-like protein
MKQPEPTPDKQVLEARVIQVDDFLRFLNYLPNPDEILRDNAETIALYREMQIDPRIKSLVRVAKAAVLNFPASIEQGTASDDVFAFCQDSLKSVSLQDVERKLLTAFEYGFSVVELLWKEDDGYWRPSGLVRRRPERFHFNADGLPKYIRNGETIALDQPYKWLVYSHDKDAENPYGTSALKACYWSWKIKKAGLEFWLMACEKFAVPSILALFDATENEEKTRQRAQELSGLLASVRSGSGAALANIKSVQTLTSEGALGEFKVLADYCDTQIAYALVSSSLGVQEAQNGTRAQAEVHEGVSLDTSKLECRDLQPVLQTYLSWIVELNYGQDEPVPVVSFDLNDYASWEMVRDAIDRAIPVSKNALYSRYGLPKPADEGDTFLKPAPASPLGPMGLADADPKKKVRPPLKIR